MTAPEREQLRVLLDVTISLAESLIARGHEGCALELYETALKLRDAIEKEKAA